MVNNTVDVSKGNQIDLHHSSSDNNRHAFVRWLLGTELDLLGLKLVPGAQHP